MIAIIPARGGSKGVPHKNIRNLNGKPLIAYTIEAALNSKYIDKVLVTTDDIEIATISQKYGASVPFMRPDYLATDTASAIDVYLHAVEFVKKNFKNDISKFMVLLPTAPLRKTKHIDEAVEQFLKAKAQTLVAMKEADTPISWYYLLQKDGTVRNANFDSNNMANRQMNKKYYIPNGAIYILDYQLLKKQRTYYSENTIPYIMSSEESVDIDTQFDFKIAEFMMKELENESL